MKYLKLSIAVLFCVSVLAPHALATSCFGLGIDTGTCAVNVSVGTDLSGVASWIFWNSSSNLYTCPGSGDQNVVALLSWINQSSIGTGLTRLAIYDSGTGALMAYGTSAHTNTIQAGGTYGWEGHATSGEITQVTPLTGGNTYVVVLTGNAPTNTSYGYVSGSSGSSQNYVTGSDYTSGSFPSNTSGLPSPSTNVANIVRVDVTAAGGSGGTGSMTLVGVGK